MVGVTRLLSLAVLLAVPVTAQQHRADIRGTVWNPDGSAAAGVPLVIVSETTGESRRFASGADGRYAVAGLVPGQYRIETRDGEHRGFAVRTQVAVAQSLDLDLWLELVPIAASADARTTFVPVDRRTPALTTRIDGAFITRLPFDGQNFLDLPLIAPGTVPGRFAIAANGLSDPFTAYLVDGIYDIEPWLGVPAVRAQLDAIDEIEIRGAMFDASFGRTAGAQVNIVSRSGTNEPRGGAFGFFRTDADRAQLGGFAGGPLVEGQTFAFGSYQFTGANDELRDEDDSQLLAVRVDHLIAGASRLSGRYALDEGERRDRRGQHAGASLHTGTGALVNELRGGLTHVAFGNGAGAPDLESQTYQLANAAGWTHGAHLVSGGVDWYGAKQGLDDELAGTTWGMFVQDDWRALPSVSIVAGIRFDRSNPAGEGDSANGLSPRVGFAWTAGREAQTVVRGGYGLYRNYTTFDAPTPRVDGWSVGVQQQIGRRRTFEAVYLGNRGDDPAPEVDRSHYDAVQLTLHQRSETGISAIVAYTYGKWTEELGAEDAVRAPLDLRHRLSAAFVTALPFGKDQRFFKGGTAAKILGDMELSGILTLQTGRPILPDREEQEPAYRNVDVALLKSIGIGDRRTLQLRAETFNLANRRDTDPGRRHQFGGRLLF